MRMPHPSAVVLAAALAPFPMAFAADTPEVAAEKRQMLQAYEGFHADGACSAYRSLSVWQKAQWPEGTVAVNAFLSGTLLPKYVSDPVSLKDKPFAELEVEFSNFCTQMSQLTQQVLNNLSSAAAARADQSAQIEERTKTMFLTRFLGQCQAASALKFQSALEHREKLKQFIVDEIYARDARYRQEAVVREGASDDEVVNDVSGLLERSAANNDREMQYWKDCDAATAAVNQIAEALKPVP